MKGREREFFPVYFGALCSHNDSLFVASGFSEQLGQPFTLGHTLDEPVTVPQAAGCITQPCCGVTSGMKTGCGES